MKVNIFVIIGGLGLMVFGIICNILYMPAIGEEEVQK